jgi:hypothetical protein
VQISFNEPDTNQTTKVQSKNKCSFTFISVTTCTVTVGLGVWLHVLLPLDWVCGYMYCYRWIGCVVTCTVTVGLGVWLHVLLPLDWVCGYMYSYHWIGCVATCTVTIGLGLKLDVRQLFTSILEISTVWVLGFGHLLTAGLQNARRFSGATKVCPGVIYFQLKFL